MIIGMRIGHSPNCLGAEGIVNEYVEQRKFYNHLWVILAKYGHKVVDCNSSASSQNGELVEGCRKANAQHLDLFISLHMNSGGGQGVEMWTQGSTSRANPYATRICSAVSKFMGIPNRGVKYNPNFYEMRNIQAPNIISEMCFVDTDDANKWKRTNLEDLAYCYANAIDNNIPSKNPSEDKPSLDGEYWVVSQYLPTGYKGDGNPSNATDGLDGIDLEYALPWFLGVRCYMRANDKGQWIETQNLPLAKCEEIKKSLGSWFHSIKKAE